MNDRKMELWHISYRRFIQSFKVTAWLNESELKEWILTECKECNGSGEIQTDRRGIDGNICPECEGK